jgi:hypothetical protein
MAALHTLFAYLHFVDPQQVWPTATDDHNA